MRSSSIPIISFTAELLFKSSVVRKIQFFFWSINSCIRLVVRMPGGEGDELGTLPSSAPSAPLISLNGPAFSSSRSLLLATPGALVFSPVPEKVTRSWASVRQMENAASAIEIASRRIHLLIWLFLSAAMTFNFYRRYRFAVKDQNTRLQPYYDPFRRSCVQLKSGS